MGALEEGGSSGWCLYLKEHASIGAELTAALPPCGLLLRAQMPIKIGQEEKEGGGGW